MPGSQGNKANSLWRYIEGRRRVVKAYCLLEMGFFLARDPEARVPERAGPPIRIGPSPMREVLQE